MFQVPEVILTAPGEDLGYPLTCLLYDGTVEVHELECECTRKQASEGGLTAAHIPDDGHGPFQASESLPRARDAFGVSGVSGANVGHVIHAEFFEERFCEHDRGHRLPYHGRRRHGAGVGPLFEGPCGFSRGEVDRAEGFGYRRDRLHGR